MVDQGSHASAYELVRAFLDSQATSLNRERVLPLDPIALCDELDLAFRVVVDTRGGRRGAFVSQGDRQEVRLFRREGLARQIRSHERFTIAHEIAHALVWREFRQMPRRRRDYWLHEELCNEFASSLLIPCDFVASLGEPKDADAVVLAVNEIARRAGVTAEPAARALAKQLKTPVAIGELQISPFARTKRLGFRSWWIESRVWLGRAGGRGLAIYTHDPLAPVIDALCDVRVGEPAHPTVDGSSSAYLRRRRYDSGAFAAVLA
jgi:hypothetical protein